MNGGGCYKCPVNPCETSIYRGSYCAAQRAKYGLGDPQTVYDRLCFMTVEEKRDALIKYFSKWAGVGDSRVFNLTCEKERSAIEMETIGFDDFKEWDKERITALVDDFLSWLQKPVGG